MNHKNVQLQWKLTNKKLHFNVYVIFMSTLFLCLRHLYVYAIRFVVSMNVTTEEVAKGN